MEKSYERSLEASEPIKIIMEQAQKLDLPYLKEALKDMRENLSFKQSASILDPDPHTVLERQDLENVKLIMLEKIIALGDQVQEIKEKSLALMDKERFNDQLKNIFG